MLTLSLLQTTFPAVSELFPYFYYDCWLVLFNSSLGYCNTGVTAIV